MIRKIVRIAVDPTLTQLMRDISAGIRVLQVRDGVVLSESQILERARNIVMGLVGNYRIEMVDRSESRSEGARAIRRAGSKEDRKEVEAGRNDSSGDVRYPTT